MVDCIFNRSWAMPNAETFSIPPIKDFVFRYLAGSSVSVDPYSRNRDWFTYTNDLDPSTSAQSHLDAEAYCRLLVEEGVQANLAIFDPPYSARQISECYKGIGRDVTMKDTQNGHLYKRTRDVLDMLVCEGGIVLSFGWNSAGMGVTRNYQIVEVLLVSHGGGHNDTICIAEQKVIMGRLG